MSTVEVVLDDHAYMPTKAYEGDAGYDLYTPYGFSVQLTNLIDTGVHVAIPKGYVGLVFPRSSVSSKRYAIPTGVIDSGYTGSIKVKIENHDFCRDMFEHIELCSENRVFNRGDRIAQLVIVPVAKCTLKKVKKLQETDRGENGFGSSGK